MLDRLVGYLVSPVLSRQNGCPLSAGRVQSPAVRLVVDREQALRERLQPEERDHLTAAMELLDRAVQEALFWLARAKFHHDRLEELYRPTVDFAGVTAVAERLIMALDRTVQAQT